MSSNQVCPFCRSNGRASIRTDFDGVLLDCPVCGNFRLTSSAEAELHSLTVSSPGAIGGWIRAQNRAGVNPRIGSDNLEALLARAKPPFKVRAELYLLTAIALTRKLGDSYDRESGQLAGDSFCDNQREVDIISRYLLEEKCVERLSSGAQCVTPKGYILADDLAHEYSNSASGFVAMWFEPGMNTVYEEGFAPAIEGAGYRPTVIRKKEHVNKIDDEIIAEVRSCRFLVADFTGHRGGVYFEAGLAMGLGKPVIWTCRNSDISGLHFDIRQYNTIDWVNAADLKDRLRARVEAVLGRGPDK